LKTVFAAEVKRFVRVLPLMLCVFSDMHSAYWISERRLSAWKIPFIVLIMLITLFLYHGFVVIPLENASCGAPRHVDHRSVAPHYR